MNPITDILDLTATAHAPLFEGVQHPWEVLPLLEGYLRDHSVPGLHGTTLGSPHIGDRVFIGEGTVVEPGACILGPAWIGRHCRIRHGAYIRENVIVGDGCVIGNSTELKNALLFNGVQAPHYNYIGDSVLGTGAHLGAGVILSNFRLDGKEIVVRGPEGKIATGLRKFGAIIGDHAEVGCHSVINPGSVIGRRAVVYPSTVWQGWLAAGHTARMAEPFGRVVSVPPVG